MEEAETINTSHGLLDLLRLCRVPGTTGEQFRESYSCYCQTLHLDENRGSSSKEFGFMAVNVAKEGRPDLFEFVISDLTKKGIYLSIDDLFSCFENYLDSLDTFRSKGYIIDSKILESTVMSLWTQLTLEYLFQRFDQTHLPNETSLGQPPLLPEVLDEITRARTNVQTNVLTPGLIQEKDIWLFFCLVCETNHLNLVLFFANVFKFSNQFEISSDQRQQNPGPKSPSGGFLASALEIGSLYNGLILDFAHHSAEWIYNTWGHLFEETTNYLSLMRDLADLVSLEQVQCNHFCRHFQTFRLLFDHFKLGSLHSNNETMPTYELLKKISSGHCPMMFRWLFNYYLIEAEEKAETLHPNELFLLVRDSEIGKSLIRGLQGASQLKSTLKDPKEEIIQNYVCKGDLLLAQYYYYFRYELGDPVNLAVGDYEIFYLAVSRGDLEISKWLYHYLTSEPEYQGFSLHSNKEEVFSYAIRSGNLALVKWLFSTSLEKGQPIDLTVNEGSLFKESVELGHWSIAKWLTLFEKGFLLSPVRNEAGDIIAGEYAYQINLPKWESPGESELVQIASLFPSQLCTLLEQPSLTPLDLTPQASTSSSNSNPCPCCHDVSGAEYRLALPCSHSLCWPCAWSFYFEGDSTNPHKCFLCRQRFAKGQLTLFRNA